MKKNTGSGFPDNLGTVKQKNGMLQMGPIKLQN